MGKNLPDILHSVNSLKSDQRIIKDPDNPKLIQLSELEYGNVKEILASSTKVGKDFCNSFSEILAKYQIDYKEEILDELKNLYKYNYSNDIDDNSQSDEATDIKIFESFKKYLLNIIRSIKNHLIHVYSRKRYYEYHNGTRPMTPDVERYVRQILKAYGWTQEPQFGGYVEVFLW